MGTTAFIGLGSNLGDRVSFIERSIILLRDTPGVLLTRVSKLQETKPLEPIKQPDFINGVARICFNSIEVFIYILYYTPKRCI